jgi:hypothetical protein
MTFGVGYQCLRGRDLLISVNQNVPTIASHPETTAAAAKRRIRQQQPDSSVGESNYHGFVSLAATSTR